MTKAELIALDDDTLVNRLVSLASRQFDSISPEPGSKAYYEYINLTNEAADEVKRRLKEARCLNSATQSKS